MAYSLAVSLELARSWSAASQSSSSIFFELAVIHINAKFQAAKSAGECSGCLFWPVGRVLATSVYCVNWFAAHGTDCLRFATK
jgi:hypothetical protein